MVNEVGTTLVNSLTNSSFDIGNMAKVLAEAEVTGPKSILERQETKNSTELNALTYLQTNLTAFKSYLTDLSSPSLFQTKDTQSSNESVVSVSATGVPVNGSYSIESVQLAQAHTLVSNKVYSSMSDTISSGTLSLTVGGQVKDIVVDVSNNTLEGLQKVINNGDYGVNASIIQNGGNYQMMFTSQNTGAANEIGLSGLADFDVDGLLTTSAAQDAVMKLNGLTVTNSTNTFDSVIEGLSIQLNSANSGFSHNLNVSQDTQAVVDTIQSFVDVYNQLDKIMEELGSYEELTSDQQEDEAYEYWGDLSGSPLLREFKNQLKTSLSGAISELSEPYNNLASVGLSLNIEGELELDIDQLNTVATNDMEALTDLFSKGGGSDDVLINVLSGNEKTQTGSYAVDVTQLAERAIVTGGGVTYSANEYRLASDRVNDPVTSVEIEAGAQFDLDINGVLHTVALTAGTYSDKASVATEFESQINAAFLGDGLSVSVAFDSSQSRYEMTTSDGVVGLSNLMNLSNQGFGGANYSGEQLIDLSAADAGFDVTVDASTSATATVRQGKYTLEELAQSMRESINSLSEVQASGASVSVSTEGGVLNVYSNRFGAFSEVGLSAFTNFTNSGFTLDINDTGQNVDGTITTALGSLNLGAYASSEDGRQIKISDYAVIGGEPAEVRGLEFEVIGGSLGARGNISFAQGFASRMEETIENLAEDEGGLLSQRIDSLNDKQENFNERRTKIDSTYERLLLKYQLQFSALQSILASTQQTRDYLSATFGNNNN
ncbi:MAG: flagellar filament capping protein FliD [Pseudomonadota bacterium]|nr:flagellar filament capping protein FliD [Pseudomonadota bacterium]